jgi:hypothetical protein
MPRFLFQMVLERVRVGISTQTSRPRKAQDATLSARSTILDIVTLSRSLMRLFMPVGLVVFFAMVVVS